MVVNNEHKYQAVIFDLDETLLNRSKTLLGFAHRFWSEFQASIPMDETGFVDQFMFLDGSGYTPRPIFFEQIESLISATDINAGLINDYFYGGSSYDGAWANPELFEGAIEGLTWLKEKGIQTGIITNGGTLNQGKKIENAGLLPLIDQIIISEAFGSKKPDASIFEAMARAMGINPQDSLFVGDHPLLDIVGASNAGFQTVWIERETPWPPTHARCFTHRVDRLAEVFKLIEV